MEPMQAADGSNPTANVLTLRRNVMQFMMEANPITIALYLSFMTDFNDQATLHIIKIFKRLILHPHLLRWEDVPTEARNFFPEAQPRPSLEEATITPRYFDSASLLSPIPPPV